MWACGYNLGNTGSSCSACRTNALAPALQLSSPGSHTQPISAHHPNPDIELTATRTEKTAKKSPAILLHPH